jgi:hypothetical protein
MFVSAKARYAERPVERKMFDSAKARYAEGPVERKMFSSYVRNEICGEYVDFRLLGCDGYKFMLVVSTYKSTRHYNPADQN